MLSLVNLKFYVFLLLSDNLDILVDYKQRQRGDPGPQNQS